MSAATNTRRAALQALYQFDMTQADPQAADDIRESLDNALGTPQEHEEAFTLARNAWLHHETADEAATNLSPDWPTHRQPVIDRCIIRIAFYELTQTQTPWKIVINEAVELAKEFSTERSPMFVNGVLDKMHKSLVGDELAPPPTPTA
jgi:N utilization substance protein B